MRVKQGHFNSLTGRLGIAAGKEFLAQEGSKAGQVYLRAGVKHEFLGDAKLYLNDIKFKDDMIGTRVYYGLGTDWTTAKNVKFYGHVEWENGAHYTKDMEVQFGLKYSF